MNDTWVNEYLYKFFVYLCCVDLSVLFFFCTVYLSFHRLLSSKHNFHLYLYHQVFPHFPLIHIFGAENRKIKIIIIIETKSKTYSDDTCLSYAKHSFYNFLFLFFILLKQNKKEYEDYAYGFYCIPNYRNEHNKSEFICSIQCFSTN